MFVDGIFPSPAIHHIGHDILRLITIKETVPKYQILTYLNYFTKYCLQRSKLEPQSISSNNENKNDSSQSFTDSEILCWYVFCLQTLIIKSILFLFILFVAFESHYSMIQPKYELQHYVQSVILFKANKHFVHYSVSIFNIS